MAERSQCISDVTSQIDYGTLNAKVHIGKVKGMSIKLCALFIVAEIAGSGTLALPKATSQSGWTGIALSLLGCVLALYCAVILGRCFTMTREVYGGMDDHVRDPYALIGLTAAGKPGKYIVEFCILFTLFGSCVVYILLASEQISDLINRKIGTFTPQNEFRLWVLISGAIVLPFTWLATPKDIWPFAFTASGCTILACIFIVIRSGMELYKHGVRPQFQNEPVTGNTFFTAFGTIAFAYGGAAILPSLQIDMKEPRNFKYSAAAGFIGILAIYLPVAVLPYLAFGTSVDDNILKTLNQLEGPGKGFVKTAISLIILHLLFAFVIIINPVTQQIEEYFGIPNKFGWKRILTRTTLVLSVVAVAEAVPNFAPILSLIGGSTITMLSFILPCWFYLILERNVPLYIKVLHGEIIVVATVCGIASTYSAGTHFSNPFKA